jgi:hypothetical protein
MLRHCFVVAAALLAGGPAVGASWAEKLFEDELYKEFGSVPRGPELTHHFRIKNTTRGPVIISNVRVSCGRCSSASALRTRLDPGEETAVVAKLYTSQFEGIKTIWLFVQFSEPQFDEVRLWMQADSRNDVNVTPDSFAFGSIKRGSAQESTTTLVFYGNAQAEVTGVESESNYIQPKAELVSREGPQVTYKLTAKLRSDVPVGKWFSDVWVKTNLNVMPRVRVPLTVEVEAALQISPAVVSFGEVGPGATATRKVIVRGVKPFRITSLKGADREIEVQAGSDDRRGVHVLTVTLKAEKAGTIKKTIQVTTDLPEDHEIAFEVKGQVRP